MSKEVIEMFRKNVEQIYGKKLLVEVTGKLLQGDRMNITSADFCELTLQEVADFLLDQDSNGAICKGVVDGRMYSLRVELSIDE